MEMMLLIFFISLLLLFTGATFKKMQDFHLTEPILALGLGIFLGPVGIQLIESNEEALNFEILKTACQFTMAIALMATALRIPHRFIVKNIQDQSALVILGMLFMWLSSAALLYIITDLNIVLSLLIGAIITPTDPVVASTIVTGKKAEKYLPESIRNTLSFEAGTNDGLAYPIVILSIFLLNKESFPWSEFVTTTLLYETILCAVLAYLAGLAAGKIMHKANKAGYMNPKALLPFSTALALLLLTGLDLLKMNGILGVFVGGLAFARSINKNEDLQEERVEETMERIFIIPVFFIFGLILPWEDWFSLGWTAVILAVAILVFRRIPVFLALIPFLKSFKGRKKDALVMGWFGPIGVAALYYALHAHEKTGVETTWVIASLIVFASTVIHGISSLAVEKKYHRNNQK